MLSNIHGCVIFLSETQSELCAETNQGWRRNNNLLFFFLQDISLSLLEIHMTAGAR